MTTDHLYRVQCKIDAGEYKAHHTAQEWAGYAVAEVFGLDAEEKSHRARILQLLKTWLTNGALKEEERKDKNRQTKKFVVVGRWANDQSATPTAGVASQGVAVSRRSATLHPAPYRGGGVAAGADGEVQVSQAAAVATAYPHGNPALGSIDGDDPAADAFLGGRTRF